MASTAARPPGRSFFTLLTLLSGLWAGAAVAQPANDNFANALVLAGANATASGTNVAATLEASEPVHAGVPAQASVWWQWTASAAIQVAINTSGSSFDTVLAVYTGSAVNALTVIASNDDAAGTTSALTFIAQPGTTYRIAVAGYETARGSIQLALATGAPVDPNNLPPVISANPSPGTRIELPPGLLSANSLATLDLIAVGGTGAGSAALACTAQGGVRVGAAGSTPTGTSFTQIIAAGGQPTDAAVAGTIAATEQNIAAGLSCVVTPSGGPSYSLVFAVLIPAALPQNAPPLLSSLPPSGASLALRPAPSGRAARGLLELRARIGTGSGSVAVSCSGSDGIRVGAAGTTPASAGFSFTLVAAAAPPDLAIAATVGAVGPNPALSCTATPSAGPAYSFSFTVAVPPALPAAALALSWQAQGPAPTTGGQSEGIQIPRSNPVSGAVHVVIPHPTNANVMYVGAVNGGVWRSSNATAPDPSWTRLTDSIASLSVGGLDLDPLDPSAQTLVLGAGRFSSYGGAGGLRSGLIRTTNGGSSWSALDASMAGRNISAVAARGSVILAAADFADAFACGNIGLFRSTDSGASFLKLTAAQGFPGGGVDALVGHPGNPAVLYASLEAAQPCAGNGSLNGIYRSADSGASWSKVSSAAMDALFDQPSSSAYMVRMQVAPTGQVVVAIARGTLRGVFHSANNGVSWTSMGVPLTTEGAEQIGVHPGGQGSLHLSVAISTADPNLVFVGGDRQPLGGNQNFPNSIGARDFSGRLFRGDVRVTGAAAWTSLTHSGTASASVSNPGSSPHADSRSMAFDASERLIQGDDGGVYARLSPANSAGDWISLNGNLQITEQHSLAYDRNARVAMSGNQDNGTMRQLSTGLSAWAVISGGDGGDVAVDRLQRAAQGQAVSYFSAQNLLNFRRRVHSATNATVGSLVAPLLTVVSGGPRPTGQFVTPLGINQVGGSRLVIGGANGVYESLDSGDTVLAIAPGLVALYFGLGGSIAYGALDNADALYVAGCVGSSCTAGNDDGVYARASLGAPLALRRANVGSAVASGLALDPELASHVFVFEIAGTSSRVFRSTNSGLNWSEITGNLPAGAGIIRSLRYLPGPFGDALALGTDTGVFVSAEDSGFSVWTAAGQGLPRAPVYRLDYDSGQDLLVAGTFGRGTFSLQGAVVRAVDLLPRLPFADGFEGLN